MHLRHRSWSTLITGSVLLTATCLVESTVGVATAPPDTTDETEAKPPIDVDSFEFPEFDLGTGAEPQLCDPRTPTYATRVTEPESTAAEVLDGAQAFAAEYINANDQTFRVTVESADPDRALDFFDNQLCAEIVPAQPGSGADSEEAAPEDVTAEIMEQLLADGTAEPPDEQDLVAIVAEPLPPDVRVIRIELEDLGPQTDPNQSYFGHFFVDPSVPGGCCDDVYSSRRSTYKSAQLYVHDGGELIAWIRRTSSWDRVASVYAKGPAWTRNMVVWSSAPTTMFLHVHGIVRSTYSVYGTWRNESFSM